MPDNRAKMAIYQSGGPAYPDQFSLMKVLDLACSQPYNGWITETTFLVDKTNRCKNLKVCSKSTDPFNDTTKMLYNVNHDNMLPVFRECFSAMAIIDAQDSTPGIVVRIGKQELHVPEEDAEHG